jgi:hypothetical protein
MDSSPHVPEVSYSRHETSPIVGQPVTKNDLGELKVTYRVLHRNLTEYPSLFDSEFLDDLQHHLQTIATSDGVDVSDHGQWDEWLNSPIAGS